jgi:thiamine-monophosphate kinase
MNTQEHDAGRQKRSPTLGEVGEFVLINDVVLPCLSSVAAGALQGNDCAYITSPSPHLAVTCDVGPRPVAWNLGQRSYWSWGWHSVVINVSDLAAAGAEPLAITTSVEAPTSFLVEDLRDFFEGLAAACKRFGLRTAGGNIRAAPRFEVHGTALGTVETPLGIRREGCRPGHRLFAIGEMGQLISAFLKASHFGFETLNAREKDTLLRPTARSEEMRKVRHLVDAASDNSDGVLGAIWNIVERSRCGVELTLDRAVIPANVLAASTLERADPWNLMFFWGDWQVVVAVSESNTATFRRIVEQEAIPCTELGRAVESAPALSARTRDNIHRVKLLRNENFRDSSFNASVEGHIAAMLHAPLFDS